VLQNVPTDNLRLPGLELSRIELGTPAAKFELTLAAMEDGEKIRGELGYRTHLFDESSMRKLAGHFENLLMEIANNLQRPVDELSMLGMAERRQLLEEWGRAEDGYEGHCLHELFETQAATTPERVAVVYGNQQFSFAQLNQRANQLAHYLRKLGVGPEVKVGICVERSLEMIVGILGILKAGGAYVPLDPDYPAERLAFMLEDVQALAVLSQQEVHEQLRLSCSARVVELDTEWKQISLESTENPGIPVDAENLAYVIYTSGSTGRPKGVGIRHGSAAALLRWANTVFTSEEIAGVLASTSICFDLSVFEIFVPLTRGGRAIIAKNALELPALADNAGPVTLVNTVPSAMAELLRIQGVPPSVRVVNLAGEALPGTLAKQVYEQQSVARLFNLYGPSEDTTYSTYAWLKRDKELDEVHIGRPIANTQVYVLTEGYQLAPVGVPGQLFIGGEGLARGYMNRPELTAEKFVPNPFSKGPGARFYRTGDLVRWRQDGNLEFLGRVDHQVKLRGYRIELGEIEATLESHAGISQAVVVARDDQQEGKRLVAYLVPKAGTENTGENELHAYIKERLPEYMIPTAFVLLEKLPLTPNGKVDRKSLPKPEAKAPDTAPRDRMELELVKIWQEVLHVGRVGIRDGFFEVGGHSLLAVRLISLIQQRIKKSLPLAALFQNPSIEQLARLLRSQDDALPASPLVEIQRGGSRTPLFFVHGAGGSAFAFAELARYLDQERSFFSFQDRGIEQAGAGKETIELMAKEYLAEMQAVQPAGPYLLGGWSMGGLVAFEMARQLEAQNQTVALLALIDSHLPSQERKMKQDDESVFRSFLLTLGLSEEHVEKTGNGHQSFETRLAKVQLMGAETGALLSVIEPPAARRLFEVYRRHIRAMNNFKPRATRLAVHLWQASDSLSSKQKESHRNWFKRLLDRPSKQGRQSQWGRYAAELHIHHTPGNHFTLLRGPHAQALATDLNVCLKEAEAIASR
jgi:amino acid adenylation domain-containing protein